MLDADPPPGAGHPLLKVGVVVIGRNPGPRLRDSLASVGGRGVPVVYADSGSTDSSPDVARHAGAEVVEVRHAGTHTAARGRNVGLEKLTGSHSSIEFVQFVDGDTTIEPGWLERGAVALQSDPSLGVVCGRLREKDRDTNVYRRLAGIEWDRPVGEIDACGGIAMMRVTAFRSAGGFDPSIAAGEEAELCGRIRRAGFRVTRLDTPMGEHDSGMSTFREWWRRTVRGGAGFAHTASKNGGRAPLQRARVRSTVLWGGVMPAVAIASGALGPWLPWLWWGAPLIGASYAALLVRIVARATAGGMTASDARLYGAFCVLAKFPQLLGVIRYSVLAK